MSEPTHNDTVTLSGLTPPALAAPVVPSYLEQVYWWAYVHPNAVQVFERDWLVNTILFGNYARLRDAALAELGTSIRGNILQIACAYGNLTPTLVQRMAPEAQLEVVDILPIQLSNLQKKIPAHSRVALVQSDSASLPYSDASQDHVLLFFLLHEQPETVRRATMAEALRVVKPGGKVVIVDYHRPIRMHPLRLLMRVIFHRLEPYAMDLWNNEITSYLPTPGVFKSIKKETFFGGLYQKLVLIK